MKPRLHRTVATAARRAAVFTTLLFAAAWAPRAAVAGIAVTRADGSISIDFIPPTEPPGSNSRQFTATIPGADTIEFTESFSGSGGLVRYDVAQPNAKTLRADLEARIDTSGRAPNGESRFDLDFNSDRPLRFRFTAHPDGGPQFFGATLDNISADARISVTLGEPSGTIPLDENGNFGQFVREGTLPAGSHHFSIDSIAVDSRSGGGFSAGFASLDVAVVPLPPAAWAGLGLMAAIAIARVVRARFAGGAV